MALGQRTSYDIDAIFRLSHRDALPSLFSRIQTVELGGGKLSGSEKSVLCVMTAMSEIRKRGFAAWYSTGGARMIRQADSWIEAHDLPAISAVFKQAVQIFTYRETHGRANLDGSGTLTERDEAKLGELDQKLEGVTEDIDCRLYRFVYENRNDFGNC